MKLAAFLLLTAPVWAQMPRPVAKATVPATPLGGSRGGVTRQSLKTLEDGFNVKLANFNPGEAVYMLGATRGVYLQGYGVVFSTELDLIQSPTTNPWHTKILAEEVTATHNRKLKQFPLLREAMKNQLATCAKGMEGMSPSDQMVMVVRLDYQPWEDRAGLPDQILLRADRKSAMAGDIQVEEQ
jgi:hypothetical protein